MAPDPAFVFVGGPCCTTLEFVFAFWIMIMFDTLLTSLICKLRFQCIYEWYQDLIEKSIVEYHI
jgi:hypothetical protein